MSKCPFCNSNEIIVETPYFDKHGERITSYCCLAQKQNAAFIDKAYDKTYNNVPDLEDVSKL